MTQKDIKNASSFNVFFSYFLRNEWFLNFWFCFKYIWETWISNSKVFPVRLLSSEQYFYFFFLRRRKTEKWQWNMKIENLCVGLERLGQLRNHFVMTNDERQSSWLITTILFSFARFENGARRMFFSQFTLSVCEIVYFM